MATSDAFPSKPDIAWYDWDPYDLDPSMPLAAGLLTLPKSPVTKIPAVIRFLENPQSPFHLPGATYLRDHDAIHIILGRGLSLQDEAFVIGYTMGNDANLSGFDRHIYKVFSRLFFRKPFRFGEEHILVFDLAADIGMKHGKHNIHLLDHGASSETAIDRVRDCCGITCQLLLDWFELECAILPNTPTSRRLRRHIKGGRKSPQ